MSSCKLQAGSSGLSSVSLSLFGSLDPIPYCKPNIISSHRVKFTFDNSSQELCLCSLFIIVFLSVHHLGLECRLITAGKNKFRMDPFNPLKQEDVDFTTERLLKIHDSYMTVVKERRKKLDVNHKTVFTGQFFTGQEAVSMGLADGYFSDVKTFCTERYGKDVNLSAVIRPRDF